MFYKIIVLLGCLWSFTVWAGVEAQVDKSDIANDEILTLVISSQNHLSLTPDLNPLKSDFDIVSTSQSSQLSIVNGHTQMQTQWQIALSPKHAGNMVIPALQVGNEKTQPQLVHVSEVKKNNPSQAKQNQDIFVNVAANTKELFIQEQFTYTVKVFFNRSIAHAYLTPPDLPDAKIRQNGQDVTYSVVHKGEFYQVLERSYFITAQKTGQFEIKPSVLKGYLEGSAGDFYSFGRYTLKPISVSGARLKVNIKPKPANFSGPWFPAKKVTLQESWEPNPATFHLGEPITRVVEVRAQGATAQQIPTLNVPVPANINVYPQAGTRETDTSNNQEVGKLIQKIVYIPTATGKMSLPAVKLHWWNNETKRQEIAILAAKNINVLPALARANTYDTQGVYPTTTSANKSRPITDTKKQRNYFWPSIAFFFLVIWMVTLFLWRRQSKLNKQGFVRPEKPQHLYHQLKIACLANEALRARDFLLRWAKTYWKTSPISSLSDLTHVLSLENDQALLAQIMQLEAVFYSRHKQWQGKQLWQVLEAYLLQKKNKGKVDSQDSLPPLHFS